MLMSFDFDIFNSISVIIDYISTLLTFLTSMINVVIGLFSTFFTTMPTFISVGFMMVFGLGFTIMIIKLVR